MNDVSLQQQMIAAVAATRMMSRLTADSEYTAGSLLQTKPQAAALAWLELTLRTSARPSHGQPAAATRTHDAQAGPRRVLGYTPHGAPTSLPATDTPSNSLLEWSGPACQMIINTPPLTATALQTSVLRLILVSYTYATYTRIRMPEITPLEINRPPPGDELPG